MTGKSVCFPHIRVSAHPLFQGRACGYPSFSHIGGGYAFRYAQDPMKYGNCDTTTVRYQSCFFGSLLRFGGSPALCFAVQPCSVRGLEDETSLQLHVPRLWTDTPLSRTLSTDNVEDAWYLVYVRARRRDASLARRFNYKCLAVVTSHYKRCTTGIR